MDYRELLKAALAQRIQKNPAYSLRAFARDLGISPGHLCEVLSGKHRLSRRMESLVVNKLIGQPAALPLEVVHPTG
ncbi:MAG: hypothetical protein AB7P04_15865 [Bacteriovoracia bacterium]